MKGHTYFVAIFIGLFAGADGIGMGFFNLGNKFAPWDFAMGGLNLCVGIAGIVMVIRANFPAKSMGETDA
jgi:hypothetical protein